MTTRYNEFLTTQDGNQVALIGLRRIQIGHPVLREHQKHYVVAVMDDLNWAVLEICNSHLHALQVRSKFEQELIEYRNKYDLSPLPLA